MDSRSQSASCFESWIVRVVHTLTHTHARRFSIPIGVNVLTFDQNTPIEAAALWGRKKRNKELFPGVVAESKYKIDSGARERQRGGRQHKTLLE